MDRKRKLAGKLLDIEIERVDGVGSPATARTWAIIKSEDAPDASAGAKAVLEALAKEELAFSKETVALLVALAEALEVEATFKSADEPEAEAADDEPEATDDEDEVVKDEVDPKVAELEEKVAELTALVEKSTGKTVASKQPKADPATDVAKGGGVFDNVIFNQ